MPDTITIGDLRTQFSALHAIHPIYPQLKDTDPVPEFKTGLDRSSLKPASQVPAVDFKAVLQTPSANPYLLRRQVDRGFLPVTSLSNLIDNRKAGADVVSIKSLVDDSGVTHTDVQIRNQAPVAVPVKNIPIELLTGRRTSPLALPLADRPLDLTAMPQVGASVGAPGRPAVVDWRNRWGWNWITSPQSQDGQNCWAMAATALIECMVRINHAVWGKRSEGDVHDGMNCPCDQRGLPSGALQHIAANGITDPADYPHQCYLPYSQLADRSGRIVKVDGYQSIGSESDMKDWLDTVGPVVLCFDVYLDFYAFAGVYRKADTINGKPNTSHAGHAVLCVGYDDNQQAWICKNSWGPTWNNDGFFLYGYGQDNWEKFGVRVTSPDPRTKRNTHTGTMLESGNGALHRNFELFLPGSPSIRQFYRDGSDFQWHAVGKIGNDAADFLPAVIQSTWNRNFELIYVTQSGRLHHWAFDQNSHQWLDLGIFGPADCTGMPSFIQGNYGCPANLELIVLTKDGHLNHCWKVNNQWNIGVKFAGNVAATGTLLQGALPDRASNLDAGTPPNAGFLEVVCTLKTGQLQHWYRDDASGFVWKLRSTFASGVKAVSPKMIEGQFGAVNELVNGHYELFVAVGGQVQHWFYDPAHPAIAWNHNESFDDNNNANVWNVAAVLEGSFGFDFELMVQRIDNTFQHYWKDGNGWHPGPVVG